MDVKCRSPRSDIFDFFGLREEELSFGGKILAQHVGRKV